MSLKVSEFVNDGLAGSINFQIKCAIFVRSRQVSDDPCKLISIEFTCGKLGDLIEAVSVTAEDLNAKTIRPIGASVSRVCANDVVGGVDGFFPDFELDLPGIGGGVGGERSGVAALCEKQDCGLRAVGDGERVDHAAEQRDNGRDAGDC